MAKEVGSRDLAAASGVTSNKALDALLKKKNLLEEVNQAKADELQAVSGEQVASADAEQVAAAEGEVLAVVADSGIIMTDAVSVAGAAGAGGLSTNTLLLIGGGTLVGGTAIALSSDGGGSDGGDGGPGGPGGNGGDGTGGVIVDPEPGVNNVPVLTLVKEEAHLEGSTLVAKFSAIDPDASKDQTSLITLEGADAALFTITNGNLAFKVAPDFEAPADAGPNNVYDVTLKVVDAEDATKFTTYAYSFQVLNDTTSQGEKPGDATAGADTFTLSDNDVGQNGPDNTNLLGGDDKFIAAVGDLDDQDNLNGGDGIDTLTATIGNGEDETPTLTSIEVINVESRGPVSNTLNLFNASGVTTVNVLDNGDSNGPLAVKNLDTGTTVNLKGDQDVTIGLKNSAGSADVAKTGVNAFTGDLILENEIETLEIAANGASDFGLKDNGGALETVKVTGAADTTLTSYGATTYDYTGASGDNTLIFAAPNADAATVLFGAGDDAVDFGAFMQPVSAAESDVVDGGAGFDVVYADLESGVTIQPVISDVEKVSLSFVAGPLGDAEFDASDVDNTPVFEIRESDAYVNVNDIENGTDIDIVGDIDNDGEGTTFDFRSGSKATTVISFVTESAEDTALTLTGDLEVSDVADLTVRVGEDGSSPDNQGDNSVLTGGEVEIFGAIALDNRVTTDLTIGTTEEDDDDTDNDGDLTVHGSEQIFLVDLAGVDTNLPVGTAITQSDKLENLVISGLNGNIFLGDGVVADGDYAIADTSSLRTLDITANNATVSLGDIGLSNGAGAVIELIAGLNGNEDQASLLEEVNIVGLNRGLFNLDGIYAGDLLGEETGDDLLNGSLDDIPFSITLNGAIIEEFNVSTAARSETKSTFEEDSTPFGFNQIENTVATAIEDLRIDVAQDGRLMWGDIYSSLVEVTITGDDRLDLFNNNSNDDSGSEDIFDEDDGAVLVDDGLDGIDLDEGGVLPTLNNLFALYFVRDIDATGHSGLLELDFRTFVGTNLDISGNLLSGLDISLINAVQEGVFDGETEVDATIRLGDQDLVDNGIRFDSYGLVGFLVSQSDAVLPVDLDLDGATVTVIAGDGNHQFDEDSSDNVFNGAVSGDTDLGIALYGLDLLGTTYGIVTGFGDDSVTTGSGDSDIYTGTGADEVVAGAGEDLIRGGFGQDTIDVGNDTDVDTLQFVGQWLGNTEEDSGETLDDNFDRILNFDSGEDVVELWNYINLDAGNDVDLTDVVVAHFNIFAPDGVVPVQEFIAGATAPAGTVIAEFTGEFLNADLKGNVNDELLEGQLAADFFQDIFATEDFFAIVWDEGQDDAALFFITSNGNLPITDDNISLVSVFEGVPVNGFASGDFQIGYAG